MNDWEIAEICKEELAEKWPYIGKKRAMHAPWQFLVMKFARDYRGSNCNAKTLAGIFQEKVVQKEKRGYEDRMEEIYKLRNSLFKRT